MSAEANRSSFRLWLDLARAGNFPSVWSNVLAALVLSMPVAGAWPPWWLIGLGFLAGSLTYAGGTTLNDVADARFDLQHRPERAIPQGRIKRMLAAWVGSVQLALGLALLVLAGATYYWAIALAAVIVLYDWLHKGWTGSVVLMAGCRVLLAVTVASLPGHGWRPEFLWWVGALFVYIVVLSLLARREYKPGAPTEKLGRWVRRMLAFIPFVDAIALAAVSAWVPAALCALAVPLGKWAQRKAASG